MWMALEARYHRSILFVSPLAYQSRLMTLRAFASIYPTGVWNFGMKVPVHSDE